MAELFGVAADDEEFFGVPAEDGETLPEGSALDYVTEPLRTIGSAATNAFKRGVAGLGTAAITGDPLAGADVVNAMEREQTPYLPETQAGQAGMEAVGKVGQALSVPPAVLHGFTILRSTGSIDAAVKAYQDAMERGLGAVWGDTTMEATGSPGAATLATVLPDTIEMLAGAGVTKIAGRAAVDAARDAGSAVGRQVDRARYPALVDADGLPTGSFDRELRRQGLSYAEVADDISRLPANIRPKKAAQEIVKRRIRAGGAEGGIAGRMLDDAGNIVDDDLAQRATSTGWRPPDVAAVKVQSPETSRRALKMLRDRARIHNNTKLEQTVSPWNHVGDSAMERFDYIRNATTNARKGLDDLVETRLGGAFINPEPVARKVFDELRGLQVKVDRRTSPPRVSFQGALIQEDKAAQRLVEKTLKLLGGTGPVTAKRAHDVKRQLDALIDFQKKSKRGLTEAGRRFAKAIRHEINQAIRNAPAVGTEYGALNDVMYNGIGALDDLNRAMGSTIDVFESGANRAVGRTLRGLLSNNRGRTNMENAVLNLDEVAADLNGVFPDDVTDLVQFANTLEERFGSTARQAFQPQVEKGVQQGLRGAGLREMAADKAVDVIEKAMSKTDEDAYRAMELLLRRMAGEKTPGTAVVPRQ